MKPLTTTALVTVSLATGALAQERNLYWCDTHLHTTNSPDNFFLGNSTGAGPDLAYRYAKGVPVTNAYTGARIPIQTPFILLVVADHREYLGVPSLIFDEMNANLLATDYGKRLPDL